MSHPRVVSISSAFEESAGVCAIYTAAEIASIELSASSDHERTAQKMGLFHVCLGLWCFVSAEVQIRSRFSLFLYATLTCQCADAPDLRILPCAHPNVIVGANVTVSTLC